MTTALCFDLKTGERIDLAAFLGKDADYAKQYAASAFSLLIKTAPDNYFDNAEAALPTADGNGCIRKSSDMTSIIKPAGSARIPLVFPSERFHKKS